MRYAAILLAILMSTRADAAEVHSAAQVKLHGLFTDNMVLQRRIPIAIHGNAGPGKLQVSLDQDTCTVEVDAGGRWHARLPAREAGGPHTLSVAGTDGTLTLTNVMVGEVWICSGQSNMKMSLSAVTNGATEVAAATHDDLRLYSMVQAVSNTPLTDVRGRWAPCNPESVKWFSAVAYYFGRELQRRLKVPVGLIDAAWGGTVAEVWTSTQTLNADPVLAPLLRRYRPDQPDHAAVWKEYERAQAAWWQAHPEARAAFHHDTFNRGLAWGWNTPGFNDGAWKPIELPCLWNGRIEVDGAVWFRRQIMVPPQWAGKDLTLSLGPIKDRDVTYFNGEQIGATGGEDLQTYMIPRSYVVPGRSVNAGAAVIAVRVFDERGGGGFGGEEKMMTLSLAVPAAVPTTAAATNPASATAAPDKPVTLRGIWKYRIERPLDPNDLKPFPSDMPYPAYRNPNRPQDLLGGLFNGMIHPLMGFGFAGAAWYQAEFNAERSEQYRTLLPAMIGDWRRAAGREFPFLIVQLPHHNGWMNWAEIREAQAMTAQCLSNVGLVVTADICDADLHPKIKLPIGQRLALQALSVAYGEKIVAGGPVYRSMTVDRRTARLKFEGVGGGLTLNTAQPGAPKPPGLPELRGFTLAGSDGKFYPAKARIEGDTVAVWTDEVMAPVAVRYAFTNPSCDANLGNAEGLPCGSFRTDDWPAQTTGRR